MSNEAWICPRCGGNMKHFNATSGSMECSTCGTPVVSADENQALDNYRRDMYNARQHLQVGNWAQAKRLVQPYCKTRPSDKEVYLYLLVAVTKCFSDLLIDSSASRREAAEYWDKLERLRCVNASMYDYARRRQEKLDEIQSRREGLRITAILLCVIVSLLAMLLAFIGTEVALLFIVLAILGWSITWKKLKAQKKAVEFKQYGEGNPFRKL